MAPPRGPYASRDYVTQHVMRLAPPHLPSCSRSANGSGLLPGMWPDLRPGRGSAASPRHLHITACTVCSPAGNAWPHACGRAQPLCLAARRCGLPAPIFHAGHSTGLHPARAPASCLLLGRGCLPHPDESRPAPCAAPLVRHPTWQRVGRPPPAPKPTRRLPAFVASRAPARHPAEPDTCTPDVHTVQGAAALSAGRRVACTEASNGKRRSGGRSGASPASESRLRPAARPAQPRCTCCASAGHVEPLRARAARPHPPGRRPRRNRPPSRPAGRRPAQPHCKAGQQWGNSCRAVQLGGRTWTCCRVMPRPAAARCCRPCSCRAEVGGTHRRCPNTCHVHQALAAEKMPALS